MNNCILVSYLFTFLTLAILLIVNFLNYKILKNKQNFNAKDSQE
ncbi:hypothetical protein MA5_04180 [Rickettsia prowazekii str. GvV257]|uniref:Uncharacterized protein n=1 Tax=Rickettsia prowazekii (strain Rp22) TaxID=449216 RepID=D5AXI4_RICPP|nr:hypothetical protein rpr22_CDS564 [Rickettsia prowazekii str. Rp22]AFE49388.1 hypothetical protein M9W_02815 [Rickettsia prowazekii str. Chernikova]AFE50232.1 hypothetical protein M9Y_02820 [Rickettsia prowazekii str. Katsinyian]AFE51078.1 hypothetical protein MA1_02810 [Rickettsia prowazekii str. BuV67-CWPP]AFE51915.1 hypothetical protein MA3_02850 [Rickettsia prowazekii str. Dachau]AFE53010.1 hypothetical protein MA5_04180 [Rickettsia prowazekii str. GvV257]AFE53582.1 hypothetical protei